MNRYRTKSAGQLLTLSIVGLTFATAYIHLSLGGLLFTLNGIGYLVLGTAYLGAATFPASLLRDFGWLARIGLAGYTLLTIGAYLAIGPYFALGWIAKGVEAALVGLLALETLVAYGDLAGLRRAIAHSVRPARRRGGVEDA